MIKPEIKSQELDRVIKLTIKSWGNLDVSYKWQSLLNCVSDGVGNIKLNLNKLNRVYGVGCFFELGIVRRIKFVHCGIVVQRAHCPRISFFVADGAVFFDVVVAIDDSLLPDFWKKMFKESCKAGVLLKINS